MQCTQCKAEHDVLEKFCIECGAAMGLTCDRCGTINRLEARHCGACGQGLIASLQQGGAGVATSQNATPIKTRQYTPTEIEELLVLRRKIMAEEESTRILRQDDIDNLFQ
jgi:hypothetical protein